MTGHPAKPAADCLVSTDWLAKHLGDADLRVFDCTTYLMYDDGLDNPYRVESGRAGYQDAHIPNAGFLDLQEDFSIADGPYSLTLPPPEDLAQAFARHGIGQGTKVVLYSQTSKQWANRFWWMLRWLGFDDAVVLDGGLPKWLAEGRTVEQGSNTYTPDSLPVALRPQLFADRDEVLAAIGKAEICTLNAMSRDLYSGQNARHGRPGRVPGSVNVPAPELLDSEAGTVREHGTIESAFEGVGATKDKRIIVYCGGGIAATLDAFLLHRLGHGDIAVYDNSMSEWAADHSLPIETD